uniref:TEP1-F n=1 Tax=Drosophila rhopaloa TaxID=1041015 RepID=A0A6P4ES42_DRORH
MTWFLLWTFIFQYVLIINAKGNFLVVAPDTLQSYIDYEVAVTLHSADMDSVIKVSLDGPSFTRSQSIYIQPMSTRKLSFNIPKLTGGEYQLTAEGLQGIIFKESKKLFMSEDKASIFIQTDKATYKPGDLLQFRVLFLDRQTRPARIDKPITIEIHDGDKNLIKQWKEVKPTKGVFSGELNLSEHPVLGNWTMAVQVQDEGRVTKDIKVDKYVLPKFGVRIHTAEHVVASNGHIRTTIYAKYSFGKPVKGKATISIEGGRSEKTVDIDGKVNVELPFASTDKSPLKVVATVTEELTDLKQNGSAYVTLHQNRYKLIAIRWPENFRGGQNITFPVAVTNVDGTAVMHPTSNLTFNFSCCGHSKIIEKPLISSVAKAAKVFPDNRCGKCEVSAAFEGAVNLTQTISKLEKSLRIELNNTKHYLRQRVEFQVISSEVLPYFMFTVVARGKIVVNKYVQVARDVGNKHFSFQPTVDMMPQATICVHYVVNGVMHSDEKTIEFEKDFGNSIEIRVPENADPGQNVSLEVRTDPHSFVGLLGVDQKVLFLRSGNDLSQEHVINDLRKYGSTGVVTLTNANVSTIEEGGECIFENGSCGVESRTNFKYTSSHKGKQTAAVKSVQSTSAEVSHPPIRQEFPETWLFMNITDVSENGFEMVHKEIPDTITSWVITGFSLNPISGFSMTKSHSKIRVFKPFFVSSNLPYSVKRGEVIAIPLVVFNYMDSPVRATVTMDNSDQDYEFSEVINANEARSLQEGQRSKAIWIPANTGASVSFMIRPKKIGVTILKIIAKCPIGQDIILEKLKVEPDGVTKYVNKAILVKANRLHRRSLEPYENTLSVDVIPTDIVPDSEFVELEVGGDLTAPTITNIDNLVRLPRGCGEQNMVNFVPNILVLRYLEATKRREPAIEKQAKKFLASGYQTELYFKKKDGSFSVFTNAASSTWLTAYVIRSFHMAAKFTDIDPSLLTAGLDFLASKQKENGEFPVNGALYSDIKNPLAFTSYVLLTFFENKEHIPRYQRVIDRAVQFVACEVNSSNDQYSLAIAALALAKAKNSKAGSVLARLESMARRKGDRKWWSKKPNSVGSHDVELTSYVLLAMLEHGITDSPMTIADWLVAQRNSNGGFRSTHDTVMGLQALTQFAIETSLPVGDMDILFALSKFGAKSSLKVTPEKALTVQSHVLPKTTREVHVSASGRGGSLVQLSYRHNVVTKEESPSFKIKTTVKDSPINRLELEICSEYTPVEASDKGKPSNMAVMEVQLPSGFLADADDLKRTKSSPDVKIVETKKGDTMVVVYFESLSPGDPKCVTVTASLVHAVAL